MKYMVTLHFRPEDGAAIGPLVPAEQAHVQQLREQGELEAIYIGAGGGPVWLVLPGDSEAAVRERLTGFPLYPYMEITLTPLM